MKQYTIELYKPAYSGNHFNPTIKARVHSGDFESNRDNLSPCMVSAKEVAALTIKGAKARAREFMSDYRLYNSRSAKY